MSKSPLITVDSNSLSVFLLLFFSLYLPCSVSLAHPPPLSHSLYLCGVGPNPNHSENTFEMHNGFPVNQPGPFTPVCSR